MNKQRDNKQPYEKKVKTTIPATKKKKTKKKVKTTIHETKTKKKNEKQKTYEAKHSKRPTAAFQVTVCGRAIPFSNGDARCLLAVVT